MKLKEGSYENIITNELQQDMKLATDNGLVCRKEDIDDAEVPSMLTEHISKIIHNRLTADDLTSEERTEFVNKLIDFLQENSEEKIADEKQMLAAVVSNQKEAALRAKKTDIVRPLTGFRTSSLFTGGNCDIPLNSEILRYIQSANRKYLIVSFLKLSGVNLVFEELKKFCSHPDHRLQIITTTYCGATEAKAVERLASLPNTEIRISYNGNVERLHAKSYIFECNSGFSTAFIGSSNLSKSAQADGLEWNIKVTNVENPHIFQRKYMVYSIVMAILLEICLKPIFVFFSIMTPLSVLTITYHTIIQEIKLLIILQI